MRGKWNILWGERPSPDSLSEDETLNLLCQGPNVCDAVGFAIDVTIVFGPFRGPDDESLSGKSCVHCCCTAKLNMNMLG